MSQGLPRDSATCILEQLNVQRWIDFQTKTVEVSFILYNGNIDVYTKTRIKFTQFEGGRIQKNLFMDSIKIRDNYRYQPINTHKWVYLLTPINDPLNTSNTYKQPI